MPIPIELGMINQPLIQHSYLFNILHEIFQVAGPYKRSTVPKQLPLPTQAS